MLPAKTSIFNSSIYQFILFMALLHFESHMKINGMNQTPSQQQFCGEEGDRASSKNSSLLKPSSKSYLPPYQQYNTCNSSTFTLIGSATHKLGKEASSGSSPCASAFSETTGNHLHYSDNDKSSNVNASGKRARKRKRVNKLSEKRRSRHEINKRLRALRNLIPNCTKMEKASILDEAIQYLKSLQLQLQIMSVLTGLCVTPTHMILPTQYHIMGAGAGCSAQRLLGLPFAGYGNRLQMPTNVESLQRSAQSLRWFGLPE